MGNSSSDYFTYKKNKMQTERKNEGRSFIKFNVLLQLFLATFIVMFIIIVIAIMKYSAKMDIEYSKGELSYNNTETGSSISGYNVVDSDEVPRNIDKRLKLIQQEENAPSEAKIIDKEKDKQDLIIASEHIENSKKIDRMEKIKAQNAKSEKNDGINLSVLENNEEAPQLKPKQQEVNNLEYDENVTISSKVLVGKFPSFEQASELQAQIKSSSHSAIPFVRKIGDVYSVQVGSFQDFATAKLHAQKLKAQGYEVWIYQQ